MRAERWIPLALVLAFARPAHAELRRPALHWTRGEGARACIDPLTLSERIEVLTGPVFSAPFDYAIEGHIAAHNGGYRLRVTVSGADRAPRGERVIEHRGQDCRAFDDAIVFLIALTVDPDLELERLTGAPELAGHSPDEALLRELDANPAKPHVEPPHRPPTLPPPPPPAAPPRPWDASFGLLAGAGELPRPGLGVLVAAYVPVLRALELAAQLRTSAMLRDTRVDDEHALRAQTFALAPLVCGRPPRNEITLRVCAGPEPSLLRARGLGFAPDRRVWLSAWGALAKVELALPLRNAWSLSVQGFLRLNFENKRFVYTDLVGERTVHQLQRWSGGAAIAVSYRFRSGIHAAAGTNLHNEREVEP